MATISYKIKWERIALIKSCNLKFIKRFTRVVDWNQFIQQVGKKVGNEGQDKGFRTYCLPYHTVQLRLKFKINKPRHLGRILLLDCFQEDASLSTLPLSPLSHLRQ